MTSASPVESTIRPTPLATSTPAQASRWSLNPRNNSLNLIRLVLATLVLVAHAFPLGGAGDGPRFAGENLGGWAVIGFFAISGYLITGSRLRSSFGDYLTHRIARIFPAFIVCLVVVAFAFAPVAFYRAHGTLAGFLSTPNTPLNYVFANSMLKISDYSVAGTPTELPYAGAWNGSLWTLYYEFLCYLIIGLAASVAIFRRTPWGIGLLFAASVAVQANLDFVLQYTGQNQDVIFLAKLAPYFLGGALVFVLKERIPLTWYVAAPSLLVSLAAVLLWNSWGGQLAAPLLALVLLWIGKTVPAPQWFQKNDISYGVYVYAWPVQQMLALFGLHEHGIAVYILLTIPPTFLLGAASWYAVERPVMRAVRKPRPAS